MANTNTVLKTAKFEAIERQYATLKSITADVERMRIEWNGALDAKLEKADDEVRSVREWLDERKKQADVHAQEEKLQFEEKLHKTKLDLQSQLQAAQIEGSQQPLHPQTPSDDQAKLPKLVITKFDGTFMDWPRFWGQFTETIDKTSVAPITKFSYLRELLNPKVKRTIEALPFTVEGYNRAKK